MQPETTSANTTNENNRKPTNCHNKTDKILINTKNTPQHRHSEQTEIQRAS